MTSPVLEGVLAIHKPPSISSFDVIRTVTPLFRKSALFQPLIERERAKLSTSSSKKSRSRHKQTLSELKIGHGGTLDPLATGVLIVGIGNGTKSLQAFLDGTKEYECTVLFGAATDSYDILGKVTKTADWREITKEKVEAAIETLRGDQMQLPPVYSSIRVDGKHLYDYARQGLPIPEIKRRSVTVHELELLEWLPPDQHEFDLPSEEAEEEAKLLADRLIWPKSLMEARKAAAAKQPTEESNEAAEVQPADIEPSSVQDKATNGPNNRPSAARLRMKVSSGFYVRSLCHDLGMAVGSAGLMATLVRRRQSDFVIGENVIEYEDFEQGEEIWGPQVRKRLEEWQAKHPDGTEQRQPRQGSGRGYGRQSGGSGGHFKNSRRNSSSDERAPKRPRTQESVKQEVDARRRNSSSAD